jgi:chemotaxis protein methyltransferase CheR
MLFNNTKEWGVACMMDYEGFKTQILTMTGINLSCYKEKQMKRRIDSLISKNGYDNYDSYVVALKSNKVLYNEFINYLTINVSEFYRNPEQWAVLEKEIFPMLLQNNKNLKIWSSACSTGDEPYTLVMVLNKFLPLKDIKIIATDIDKGAIEKAVTGVYTSKSIESLPKEFIDKYFIQSGEVYRIKDEVKRCVEFRQMNLLRDEYPHDCDLVVCRNVLIYFTEDAKVDIYKKFNKSLKLDGILFVGSTEQIILSNRYSFKSIRTFFYLKEAAFLQDKQLNGDT